MTREDEDLQAAAAYAEWFVNCPHCDWINHVDGAPPKRVECEECEEEFWAHY